MAIVRNLATVKTTAGITSSATSIPVNRVDVFGTSQTTLDKPFYVTIMPASGDEPANSTNSEIVLVTGISGTNLTVTRGQRSTTAKAFNSGAIVTMGIYAEDAVLLGDDGTAVGTPAPWIDTSDIKNGAVTTDKVADGAVKSAKIDWATFSYVSNVGSSVIDVTQTVTTLCEVTIPETGVYFATATTDANLLALDVGNANVFLALNGSDIAGARVFFNNNGRDWFMGGCTVSAIVSCNKGDKIQFRGQSGLNHWQAGDRRRLDAFRIG